MIRLSPSLCLFGLTLLCSPPAPAADTTQPATSPALQIVGGPYLQAPSPTSITLVWMTNNRCVSKVEYGQTAGELRNTAVSARHGLIDANTTLHRITLRGLEPGTTYHYRVISTEMLEFEPYKVTYGHSVNSEGQFTTLDPRKGKFSFCVVNDRHDQATALRQGLASIKWDGVDLVVGLGDMIDNPTSEEQIFQGFVNPCTEFFASRIPLVFVRGNHEARGVLARNLMDYFPTESGRYYYSFDHGGVHFMLLDGGEDKADNSEEYSGLIAFDDYLKQETEWLKTELRSPAFRDARFRVCLLHMPPDEGSKDKTGKFIRGSWIHENWTPLLSEAGLDLMISGHIHRYAELPKNEKRAYPIVVGGTNTVIRVDVSPERLQMTTFKNDGTMFSQPPEVQWKSENRR